VLKIGHSIYYDRAFIRVDDKFVPLVNSGASNSASIVDGRMLTDKGWSVLNWRRYSRVLFSEAEIRDIAKDYEQHSTDERMSYKSRYKPFAPGEFERWIIGGMKRARTVEEYCSYGNDFYISVAPAQDSGEEQWAKHSFTTTEELLAFINQLGKCPEIDISLENSRELYLPSRQRTDSRGRNSVLNILRTRQAQPGQPKPRPYKSNDGIER
jgi:hypothetical protein